MSGLLLFLAVPRLVAALALLPGSAAVELLERGSLPTEAGLKRAILAQLGSLAALPHAPPHFNIAYLAAALAESGGLPEAERAEFVAVARHHLEQALVMAPGHSRAWFMLAGLRHNSGDGARAAARSLVASYATDPHFPLLAPLRWPMALLLEDALPAEVLGRADAEFLTFFRLHPDTAARLALRADRLPELQALAAASEADLRKLAAVVSRIGPNGG